MALRLVIAEKPSVAQTIAAALGVKGKQDGYIEGGGYLISWLSLIHILFLPVQIRRTGEVDILRALAACQGQGGDFQSEAAKIRPDLDADNPHIIRCLLYTSRCV